MNNKTPRSGKPMTKEQVAVFTYRYPMMVLNPIYPNAPAYKGRRKGKDAIVLALFQPWDPQ